MANIILGTQNFADVNTIYTPTLSGGSWSGSLPLTNLQDYRLAKVSRSTSATLVNTQFEIDFQIARAIGMIVVPKHTLSQSAKYRFRLSNTAGVFTSPVYDSGWINVWGIAYPWGTLPWGHPSFWNGLISAEDAVGYNIGLIHLPATIQFARYMLAEFDDTTNAAGYVDLARLFVAQGWRPSVNASYGLKLQYTTKTVVEESLGGVDYFDRREPRRIVSLQINNLDQDEGLVWPQEVMHRNGLDQQVFYVQDSDDTYNLHRISFLANIRELTGLEFAYEDRVTAPIELKEVI